MLIKYGFNENLIGSTGLVTGTLLSVLISIPDVNIIRASSFDFGLWLLLIEKSQIIRSSVNANSSTAVTYATWNHISVVYDAVSQHIFQSHRGTSTSGSMTGVGFDSSSNYLSSCFLR